MYSKYNFKKVARKYPINQDTVLLIHKFLQSEINYSRNELTRTVTRAFLIKKEKDTIRVPQIDWKTDVITLFL